MTNRIICLLVWSVKTDLANSTMTYEIANIRITFARKVSGVAR